jgi:alcohol dehydrogenase class IV
MALDQTLHCELRMHVSDVKELVLPRHVVHGDGAAEQLASSLGSWGVAAGTALVVVDQFLFNSGATDSIIDGLKDSGWKIAVFSDVSGEPTDVTADAVAEAARQSACDVVIGIGGGSAMDLAKVGALLRTNAGTVSEHIGVDRDEIPSVPLVLIPTTTGTGAEATRVAVLSTPEGKRVISHRSLVPLGAVLDAKLVLALPASVTAATGMDALAHALESCMSTNSTALTSSMSLRATDLLLHWLPIAFADPTNLEARRATLYGSFLAGVGLNAGVVLGHSMAYTVANRTHLAHGVTCAMALPYCVAFNASGTTPDVNALANVITGGKSDDLRVAAESLAVLVQSFQIPATPTEAGIARDEESAMAVECATTYNRANNPVPMTVESLQPLYAAWFDGNLASV